MLYASKFIKQNRVIRYRKSDCFTCKRRSLLKTFYILKFLFYKFLWKCHKNKLRSQVLEQCCIWHHCSRIRWAWLGLPCLSHWAKQQFPRLTSVAPSSWLPSNHEVCSVALATHFHAGETRAVLCGLLSGVEGRAMEFPKERGQHVQVGPAFENKNLWISVYIFASWAAILQKSHSKYTQKGCIVFFHYKTAKNLSPIQPLLTESWKNDFHWGVNEWNFSVKVPDSLKHVIWD